VALLEQKDITPSLRLACRAAEAAERTGEVALADRLYEQAVTCVDGAPEEDHAGAVLLAYARRLTIQGDPDRAIGYFDKALADARRRNSDD
jgi:tetratricopeptide (TPR) repeat protein